MPRSLRPLAVLGLLSLLSAGALVLALFQAPSTPNLVVHNGAGETLLAKQLTLVYASSTTTETATFEYQAPDRMTVTIRNGPLVRQAQIPASEIPGVFGPLDQLKNVDNFVAGRRGRFVGSFPAAEVVAPAERPFVSGQVRVAATVRNGYLVRLSETVHLSTRAAVTAGAAGLCVRQIDGARTQVC